MQKNTFLEGKILPVLIKFSLPLMLSLILQALYGAVDLIVVGHYGHTEDFSAVATGSQFLQAVTGIIVGLTTGVTVLIGQAIGSGNKKKAGDITAGMTKLLIVLSVILYAVLMLFTKQAVSFLNVPSAAVLSAEQYIRICACGIIFISAYNAISGIFRGVGNSKMPLVFIMIACVINIIGDLIFVGVFSLGAAGAAIATVLAQAASVVFSVIYMMKGGLPFKINKGSFKAPRTVSNILKIGVPIALQDFLTRISFLILTAIMNSLGLTASASIGISEKLFVFLSIVPISFMSALSAFVAQNVGAANYERAYKSLKIASLISFICGLLVFSLVHFAPDFLSSIFEKSPEVIAASRQYLLGTSYEHIFISISFCMLGYFNGLGKTTFVMIQGLVTAFCVRIPLSYYFSHGDNVSLYNIGLAVPLSAIFALFLCAVYLIYTQKKLKNKINSNI